VPYILLAQSSPLTSGVTPPPLDSPPLLPRLIFEQPLPLVALFIGGAVVAFVVLNRRFKAKQGVLAAGGLLLAAGALWLTASLVQTDREQIMAETSRLIGATTRVDTAALDNLLAPDVRLFAGPRIGDSRIPSAGWDKKAILENTDRYLRAIYKVDEAAVLEMQGTMDGPTSGRTQARIRTTVVGAPFISWWRVTWRRSGEGRWEVTAIEPLEIPGSGLAW